MRELTNDLGFEHCNTSSSVLAAFHDTATKLGIVRFGVVASRPLHSLVSATTQARFWGFDKGWEAEFRKMARHRSKGLEDRLCQRGYPILWRDLEKLPDLTNESKDILAGFFRYHPKDGVTVPLFGPNGFQFLLYLAFTTPVIDIDDPRIDQVVRVGLKAQKRYIELFTRETVLPAPLSPREQDVLERMAAGHSKKRAALDLGISVNSIDTYQRRIFEKLGVNDRTDAVIQGLSLGLIRL